MDGKTVNKPRRDFDSEPRKRNFLANWMASSNFIIVIGLLITGTGVISFIPFHNFFSKIMLIAGLGVSIFGFFLRILQICIQLIGGRA